jgi:rhodanese-related sulfurtransferase
MRRLTIPFALSGLIVPAAAQPAKGLPPCGAVDGDQSRAIMKKLGSKLFVLDVRTAKEFAENPVPGAALISVQELEDRMDEIPTDLPVLVICRVGRRAATAFGILQKARPELMQKGLWYFNGQTQYKRGGKATLK